MITNPTLRRLLESAPFTTISTEGRLFTQKDMAVFAEMIIEEATDLVGNMLDQDTAGEVIVEIKQHFGVL